MTRISLTPVIDVVFILLIFFMLASNFNKIGEIDM
ncbi:MAG: biopolymer transporter ExbD, partial [Gammaproteobacteria bacterium]|nr:biopolymer transporter ExbD [Gammaproteobacteria bacterium]